MTEPIAQREWMTVTEVARATGFSEATVYRALERGELRGCKPGRGRRARWRIARADFESWMRAD